MTTPINVEAPLDEITTALLAFFDGTGRKTWDGAYGGSPTSPSYPYHLMYRLPGGSSDLTPDLAETRRVVEVVWQLTTVSNLRNQCEKAATIARKRLLDRTRDGYVHPLAMPEGWVCTRRRPDPVMPGIDRTGNEPNSIFSLPQRFYLTLAST